MASHKLKKLRGELLHLTSDLEEAIEHYSAKYVRYLEEEVQTLVWEIKFEERKSSEDDMEFWDKRMKNNGQ